MKKFINRVEDVENEMVAGLVKAFPRHVRKLESGNTVVRAETRTDKVALVSGGGSGHEPSFGGYVGTGMLDAAIAGAVYTSPAADQIYEAIKAVVTEKGVLLAIMGLRIKQGTSVKVIVEGEDETACAEAVKTFLQDVGI